MRVLLVDDEYELISTMAERLILRGYETDWASTGSEALTKVKNKDFDLVVLDLKMPKISGLDLKCKLEGIRPGMKYIFMTGQGPTEIFSPCFSDDGGDMIMIKPVKIDVLLEKMEKVASELIKK